MSKLVLLLILSGFITYSIISLTQNKNVNQATENSVYTYSQTKARNLANSTTQLLMSQVADDLDLRVSSPVTKQIFHGQVTYKIIDEFFDGEDLIKFSVTASIYNETKKVTVYAKPLDPHPTGVTAPAAITANNNILTLGNITVDGRNHTKEGNLISNDGTYGIWTTETFSNSGASKIGGTNLSKNDFIPSKNPDPSIIAQNQTWPGGKQPSTPEEVIENLPFKISLKEYAKSGDFGSQYVTDPDSLKYPLKGVTYVEPVGGAWIDANIEGEGILIVHNDKVDAIIKNTSNNFTGLIIADDIIHLHSTIIGAVISLTQNPSEGNTIGNSDGFVLYSKEALSGSLMTVRPRNFGFSQNRLNVKHWFE
jgi:hypothetical protein